MTYEALREAAGKALRNAEARLSGEHPADWKMLPDEFKEKWRLRADAVIPLIAREALERAAGVADDMPKCFNDACDFKNTRALPHIHKRETSAAILNLSSEYKITPMAPLVRKAPHEEK